MLVEGRRGTPEARDDGYGGLRVRVGVRVLMGRMRDLNLRERQQA